MHIDPKDIPECGQTVYCDGIYVKGPDDYFLDGAAALGVAAEALYESADPIEKLKSVEGAVAAFDLMDE